MARRSRTFTIAETVALTGVSERQIRNEIEREVVDVPRTAGRELRLGFAALLYFEVLHDLREDWSRQVGPELRKEFYRALKKTLSGRESPSEVVVRDKLVFRLGALVADTSSRAKRFEQWCSRLVHDDSIKGGEPVFANSRLSVRHVGELLLGEKSALARKELTEDHPFLTREDLEFAPLFVKAYPRVGRPTTP